MHFPDDPSFPEVVGPPPAGGDPPPAEPDAGADPAPPGGAGDDPVEPPGEAIAGLREELVAATTEARRGNRRIVELLKNLGTVLDALSATVNDTHRAMRTPLAAAPPAPDSELSADWARELVAFVDRIDRVDDGFARPPAAAAWWWPPARRSLAAWRDAWAMQADAFAILRSHTRALLERARLERIPVVGQPFDPHTMTAVESAVVPDQPDHTVLAELLPGWRHSLTGAVIRPAQVRVSRQPPSNPPVRTRIPV